MENELSLTAFLATLGCRLRIGYYWSAQAEDESRVTFTIWDDQLADNLYLLWPTTEPAPDWTRLPGAYEWRRHVDLARQGRAELLGVLCHAVDPNVQPRQRAYYDDAMLLALEIIEQNDGVFARVVGEVSVDVAKHGLIDGHVVARPLAMDDVADVVPDGIEHPERVFAGVSSFRRNAMVRRYVIQRAQGKCELCGKPGFIMRDGRHYLETHHILSLTTNGADSVENVIGLCAEHHREAHYGTGADSLNDRMLDILRNRRAP